MQISLATTLHVVNCMNYKLLNNYDTNYAKTLRSLAAPGEHEARLCKLAERGWLDIRWVVIGE